MKPRKLRFSPEQPPQHDEATTEQPQVQRAMRPENLAAKVQTNVEIEEAALGNFYREMDLAARNTIIETH